MTVCPMCGADLAGHRERQGTSIWYPARKSLRGLRHQLTALRASGLGETSKIESIARQILQLNPNDLPALLAVTECLEQRGAHADALTYAELAWSLQPANAIISALRDRLRVKVARDAEARKAYAEGMADCRAGAYQSGATALRRARNLGVGDPELAGWLGLALLELRQVVEALSELGPAANRCPDWAECQCWLGRALETAGQLDQATEAYGRALAIDPGLMDAQEGRRRVAQKQERRREMEWEERERAAIRAQMGAQGKPDNAKDAGVAVLLALVIPGAGHLYCGRIGAGVGYFIGIGICLASGCLAPFGLIIYVVQLVDAYNLAKNTQQPNLSDR